MIGGQTLMTSDRRGEVEPRHRGAAVGGVAARAHGRQDPRADGGEPARAGRSTSASGVLMLMLVRHDRPARSVADRLSASLFFLDHLLSCSRRLRRHRRRGQRDARSAGADDAGDAGADGARGCWRPVIGREPNSTFAIALELHPAGQHVRDDDPPGVDDAAAALAGAAVDGRRPRGGVRASPGSRPRSSGSAC